MTADPHGTENDLRCTACSGTGAQNSTVCTVCNGYGVVRWSGGTWLAWRRLVSRVYLVEERMERVTHAAIDGTLISLGIIGVAFGVLEIFRLLQSTGSPRTWDDLVSLLKQLWLLRGLMRAFWVSLLIDLYLFYRIEQGRRITGSIPIQGPDVSIPESDFSAINPASVVDVSNSFTRPAQLVVEQAFALGSQLNHATVEPIHLLAAVAGDADVALALLRLGITRAPLRDRMERALGSIPRTTESEPVISYGLRTVLVRAYQSAQHDQLLQVTPPHLLEALSREPGRAQEILFDLNADEERTHNVVLWSLMQRRLYHSWSRLRQRALNKPKGNMDRAMTAQATPVLEHFSVDLTQAARRGALPLIVDREREIEDVFRVVESGRHNVILVGEKGVGTTSVLQSIAERMAAEDVPGLLQDKRLVLLSVHGLVSGAGSMGELEKRLEEIMVEIVKSGNIVLAVEDIHELVGVSSVSGATMDLASVLGKVLESRAFVAFGTTTPEGYRKHIEPSALFTAFEKVDVPEVTPEVAIQILESRSGSIEARHRVFFSYLAIEKIVQLSVRYVHDRQLPEKALTFLEEIAAYTRAAKGAGAVVTAQDASAIISRRTHANVADVNEDEVTKLLHLEERMHERMVGQDHAVKAVSSALRRSRAELRDPKRPIAVFLFLGPTGVGKTELAKTVADVYFGNEANMIRLDMSEYQEPSSITRLLGAPEGYGSGSGYLTEAVRINPFSLILLDELEKAHPDILNVFLQVFDDGRLTDAKGRTIDFTNTIIIATSNAGTDVIQQRMREGAALEQIRTELIERVLGRYYRPEFLNRFDEVIVFTPLSSGEIEQITELLLKKIAKQLEAKGIAFRATPDAVKELAAAGFDPIFGARPLRRVLQERVDNAIATHLLTGKLSRRDVAVLETGGVVRVERAQQL